MSVIQHVLECWLVLLSIHGMSSGQFTFTDNVGECKPTFFSDKGQCSDISEEIRKMATEMTTISLNQLQTNEIIAAILNQTRSDAKEFQTMVTTGLQNMKTAIQTSILNQSKTNDLEKELERKDLEIMNLTSINQRLRNHYKSELLNEV